MAYDLMPSARQVCLEFLSEMDESVTVMAADWVEVCFEFVAEMGFNLDSEFVSNSKEKGPQVVTQFWPKITALWSEKYWVDVELILKKVCQCHLELTNHSTSKQNLTSWLLNYDQKQIVGS